MLPDVQGGDAVSAHPIPAASVECETGLAGLEPTTYGLGIRMQCFSRSDFEVGRARRSDQWRVY
jgi:hypothetical protein